MEIVACPPSSDIARLLSGEITGSFALRLTSHLESCSRCLQSVQMLAQKAANFSPPKTKTVVAGLLQDLDIAKPGPPVDLSFLAPPTGENEIGWLGHYRIMGVLGEGGMGLVFLAEDSHLGRAVALKVIKEEFRKDEEVIQRFGREARAMAQVKSDHVVTIHQVGQHNGISYIAMELLEGCSLVEMLDEKNRPTLVVTLRIVREIAQALAAAHGRGLIHRDIKPENIWLEAPNGRVKLLDFGLARPQNADVKLTKTGIIIGTPSYMSPEHARAEGVDERSDLFSLGCLLYELISGRRPFYGPTILAILLALAEVTPVRPSHYNRDCPPQLDDLILKLLEKNPANRPQTAQSVIDRLQMIERELSLPFTREDTLLNASRPSSPSDWLRGQQPSLKAPDSVSLLDMTSSQRIRPRDAERRQVTVLFCHCDLFESEDYVGVLDLEDQAKVSSAFAEACRKVVLQWQGTVLRCNDEGLLACFGYPVAYEDAPQLASHTALAILEALTQLGEGIRREHNLELNPRFSLHTGTAIVEIKGTEVSLAGEARNVAVRLKDVAGAGQIVCSAATQLMLRGKFNSLSLGEHKIKGIEQPIELFQLLAPIDDFCLIDPVELTPLTGRDQEISLLKDRWEQAQEGMGQVVLLVGEAGLGKSRLVHAMKKHVRTQALESDTTPHGSDGAPVIEWHCTPHSRNTGLYPASNFFQRFLKLRQDEPPEVQFERLLRHLESYGLATPNMVPLFASLLSLPTDTRYPSLVLSPSREREETFKALTEWLRAYSSRQPVLFIIEDLHWLDASTLEFLGQFLSQGSHDRILTLLTFRPEFRTPWPVLAHQTSLPLNRLTKRQVAELMRKKTGTDIPDAVVDKIFDRSGGVPLFVEEFTKMVQDSGTLEKSPDDGTRFKTLMAREIPVTLQDSIMARLDRMDGDRELAQLCSTLGRAFSFEVLAAVAAIDEQLLEGELNKLVQAEVLYQKGRSPNATYVFKHALLEDALYNAMVKNTRQVFHGRIADVLQSHFPQIMFTQPELIAHHLTEGGQAESSIPFWLTAGLRAQEQFANMETISHLTKGMEVLSTLPASSERDRYELSFLSPLGSAYQVAFGYSAPEVGPTFARARELGQKTGGTPLLFEIMWGNWTWHLVRGDLKLCLELADEMMALAENTQDRGISMEAYVAPAATLFYMGDFAGCRKHCEKAIAEYEDLEQCLIWSGKLGQNSAIIHRCYLSLALWQLGYPDRAIQTNKEMLSLARQIAHPFSLAHALHFTGWLNRYFRNGENIKVAAQEQVTIATEQKFALWHATGTFFSGAALRLLGDMKGALEQMEKGIRSFKAIASLTVPSQLSVLGEGYTKDGQFEKAQQAFDEALVLAEEHNDCSHWPELHRLKGDVALFRSNDQTTAEICYNSAVETARRQQSKAWELRATISLARLWQKQGHREQARTALATIYGAYDEGFTTPELVEAKELLADLAKDA